MTDPFPGGFGGFDPRMFSDVPLFRELAKVMNWRGGPVNWDLARQTASSVIESRRAGGPRALPAGERDDAEFAQAVAAAELWLDGVTVLPAVDGPARRLDERGWMELATSGAGLGMFLEPVAQGMSEALGKGLGSAADDPALRSMLGGAAESGADPLARILAPMSAMMYGIQAGTVAGHLAGQLLGTYDLGVPTVDPRTVATVGDAAERFAGEHEIDATEFRYWLALREAAHRRQFAGVPWLRDHLASQLRRFAAAADFDPNRLMESFGGGMDPTALTDPAALQSALEESDAFHIEPTAAQREVLTDLQALVAFTTAWVDTVVRAAAADKLPSLGRLEEAVRRRRADKGPGEQFLQQLVGLDLQSGDVRAAQRFCDAVVAARGQAGLDRAWASPEALPTAAELPEASRWLVRMAAVEVDGDVEIDLGDLPEFPDDLSGLDDPES